MVSELVRRSGTSFDLHEIDILRATDSQLIGLSDMLRLNLSLEEMLMIRVHFRSKGRNPTDVELQSIAQAWSEHCCYKSSKVFLREHIFGIEHEDVLARGDAGVMAFDDEHAYALRIESHNHPSAIEPYGGAATGIGGIVRDVLCMGAQPIALIDPLFFGPLDHPDDLPTGVKHPKYLMTGVVAGIRDYGNRIGIPTVSGGVYFDEGYVGNCLVNVGCVGIVSRGDLIRNAVGAVGDLLILVGGRTGRDGIHGVTFASAELSERSEEESRGAVQLGDPITKEPLIHACLEVNRRGLVSGMKDLGGGGLSCVVGEMALAAGFGAEVELDRVPLKEEGLAPWEIWVSESQERMMLAAPEDRVEEIMEVFDLWDVTATVIGRVVEERVVRLYYEGEKVFDLELEFLTKGPEYCRPCAIEDLPQQVGHRSPKLPEDLGDALLRLLSDPNIASREWVVRQYDHEVRASTVVKPLQGRPGFMGHGDATVIRPLEGSTRGLAIAVGVNPWFTHAHPYRGGKAAVDEVCRNIAAVGGRPHSLTDCLNFGNPEKPRRLGEFREAVRGIGEVASALRLPIPSGNVSFYNETANGAAAPTPTVMGVGIVEDIRRCVTADFKRRGNPVYLLGSTREEMGGSALYRAFGGEGGEVPDVNAAALSSSISDLLRAMEVGAVAACHDCADGGLAVALAEMCISGNIGLVGDLPPGDLGPVAALFSESNTRWVVEIEREKEGEWRSMVRTPATRLGEVRGGEMSIDGVIELEVERMREAWDQPLWRLLG